MYKSTTFLKFSLYINIYSFMSSNSYLRNIFYFLLIYANQINRHLIKYCKPQINKLSTYVYTYLHTHLLHKPKSNFQLKSNFLHRLEIKDSQRWSIPDHQSKSFFMVLSLLITATLGLKLKRKESCWNPVGRSRRGVYQKVYMISST